jgi:sugar (pentulose or hexulose) kinase
MDAKTKTWSAEILSKLDIPLDVLPPIVAPGTVIGEILPEVAKAAGLTRAKLIAVGSHDTASAYAAAPVANTAEALIISSGTWSLVGKLLPEPITTPEALAANMSNEGGIGNIRFLRNCMGSWLAQELRRVWRIADGREPTWKELDRLTEAAPAFAVFIDPDDPGFYNPTNMEIAIAEFCKRTGQKVPSDRGSMLRAVYEGLAMKYRMVNELICRISKTESRAIHIVGGGSRNPLLNQFTADACGLPVVAGPEEATAVGNIMVQAMGLGLIRSLPEALPIIRSAFPIQDYKPKDLARWNQAYVRFREIVERGTSGR